MEKIESLINKLTITWYPSFNCNFSCAYCASWLHQKNAYSPSLQDLEKIFNALKAFFPKDRNTNIWFAGGEPSQISHLPDFVNLIKKDNNIEIGLNSNGSASFEYYDNLFQNIDLANFSVHFDFIKYKAYFKKLMRLYEKYEQKISFSVMVDKRHFDDVEKTCALLKKYKINHSIIKINGRKDSFNQYSDEELDFINQYKSVGRNNTVKVNGKNYTDYTFKNLFTSYNNFKDWKCYVPQQHLYVAGSKLYAGLCKIKYYGDLLEDVIKPIDNYVICDGRKCQCMGDLRASKEKVVENKIPINF